MKSEIIPSGFFPSQNVAAETFYRPGVRSCFGFG